MSEVTIGSARGRLLAALAFVKSAEPRRPVSSRALVVDVVIAMGLLVAALFATRFDKYGVLAAVLVCGSLAVRRVFPLSVFFTVLGVALLARNFATSFTFIAIVFAAYSAVVHSRFRGAALITMAPACSSARYSGRPPRACPSSQPSRFHRARRRSVPSTGR